MVTGDKPDEQVDWSTVQAVIDEATEAERLPRVCSIPECEGVPVVRWSPSDDVAELLCAKDAAMVGLHRGTGALVAQLARHGLVIAGDVHVLIDAIGDALLDELEVLS